MSEVEKSPNGLKPGTESTLARTAIRNRWPVSDELKKKTIDRMADVLCSEDNRDCVSAAKVIVAADKINQEDDHLEDKNSRLDDGKPTENVQFKAFLGIDTERI